MAQRYKCHGPQCPYGWGHHDEHVAAAKLGWERRRHGKAIYDGAWKGYEAHRHNDHYILRNTETGEHYEVPAKSYEARFFAAKRAGQHAQVQERLTDRDVQRKNRQAEHTAAMEAKRTAATAAMEARKAQTLERRQAAVLARLDRESDAAQARLDKKKSRQAEQDRKKAEENERRGAAVLARLEASWAIAQAKLDKKVALQAERDAKHLEKIKAAEDRYMRLYERTELYQYLSGVTISPYRNNPSLNREMYSRVPYKFRHKKGTRNSDGRLTRGEYLDELAATMAEEAPWLGITNDEELVQAFDRVKEAGRRKGFVAGRRMRVRNAA